MRPFIVAEMSANHLGSLKRALQIVEAAAEAGADAIKLQTWLPDSMCVDETYRIDHGPWNGQLLAELYREAWTPWEWHKPIFDRARKLGLEPFSAAFDRESVDFLETLGVKRHKVASFELVDLPLIRYMASKGKPMILSTGMATFDETDAAYQCAGFDLTFLVCVSSYPAKPSDYQLRRFSENDPFISHGLSDHTIGHELAVWATIRGATMIEKHLTLSRSDGGPDAAFSAEPAEFAEMVKQCRRAAEALKPVELGPRPGESTELRRSLWVTKDTKAGEPLILNQNVRTARPALGLPCDTLLTVAAMDLRAGTPLTAEGMA